MQLVQNLQFFRFSVTASSCNHVRACRTRSICSSGVCKIITILSIKTRANGHFIFVRKSSFAHWNVSRDFFNPKGILLKRKRPWWDVTAVMYWSFWAISACEYSLFAFSVKNISGHLASRYIPLCTATSTNPGPSLRSTCYNRRGIGVCHLSSGPTQSVMPILSGRVQ